MWHIALQRCNERIVATRRGADFGYLTESGFEGGGWVEVVDDAVQGQSEAYRGNNERVIVRQSQGASNWFTK